MSISLEHDYIGLSESMEASENSKKGGAAALNLKATELRLGLPGSESPERDCSGVAVEDKTGFSLSVLKPTVSGAKRVFSDAIDGASGKWVIYRNVGSEADLGKCGKLVSPRGVNVGKGLAGSECKSQTIYAVKDGVQQSPNPLYEKKPQVSAHAV